MRSDVLQQLLTAPPLFAPAFFDDSHDTEAPVHTLRAEEALPTLRYAP